MQGPSEPVGRTARPPRWRVAVVGAGIGLATLAVMGASAFETATQTTAAVVRPPETPDVGARLGVTAQLASEEHGRPKKGPPDAKRRKPGGATAEPQARIVSQSQVLALVKQNFPADEVGNAMAVAQCESGQQSIVGPTNSDGTTDWGVFQLNDGGTLQDAMSRIGAPAETRAAQQAALDAEKNIRAAAAIFEDRGWSPWVCAYKQQIVSGLYSNEKGPMYGRFTVVGGALPALLTPEEAARRAADKQRQIDAERKRRERKESRREKDRNKPPVAKPKPVAPPTKPSQPTPTTSPTQPSEPVPSEAAPTAE